MKKYTGRAVFLCFALAAAVAVGGCGTGQRQGKGAGADAFITEDSLEAESTSAAGQEEADAGTALQGNTEQRAGQNRAVDAQIELMNFGNTGRNIVEIPQFVTESGESTRAMEDLNAETESLQELYEKVKEENDGVSFVEIRSYIMPTTRFLQVTTTYCEYPTYGTWGDLMTLAYDTKTDTAITAREALKMSGYTGDRLSTSVHKAYVKAGLSGQIESTEMEGFELDDTGKVTAIYMKLGVRAEESDSSFEAFYRYVPSTGKIFMMAFSDEDEGDGSEEISGSEMTQ